MESIGKDQRMIRVGMPLDLQGCSMFYCPCLDVYPIQLVQDVHVGVRMGIDITYNI